MKIGLISDVHATPAPLAEALQKFAAADVDLILCAGDIAGYGDEVETTITLLEEHGCLAIRGNHDSWYLREHGADDASGRYLASLPFTRQLKIDAQSLLMVHGSPSDPLSEGLRLRNENGDFIPSACTDWAQRLRDCGADILIVGHTHQVFARELGGTLAINPGSTCFNHTCMILSLPELQVEILALSERAPLLSWNFGMERGSNGESA